MKSSTLNAQGRKAGLLLDICKQLGAKRYLSPIGSKGYIKENNLFEECGIELCYQNYCHPEYIQRYDGFIAYMSILDLLFNEGDKSLDIIRSGQKENILS